MKNNNKLIFLYAVLAIILIAGIYFWPSIAGYLNLESDKGAVTFINPNNQDEVEVVFNEDEAVFSGLGYSQLVLQHATSASGARFVNEDINLELWNRGNDLTVSLGGEQVFSGNTTGETDADKLAGTWVWQATTIGGVVTEPNRPGVFSITFNDGTGTVQGKTDCNGFGGSYKVGANDSLNFGPLNSTLMYCEGSQEQEFVSAISTVRSYYFTGSGALVLELPKGDTMLFSK